MANAAITNPATASTQPAPVNANTTSPINVDTESSTQIRVSAASARISGSARATPTRRFASARSGMTTSDATRSPVATGELSGVPPTTRVRTPSTVT